MASQNKLVSIVIPVYNEEKTIEEIIRRVSAAKTLDYKKEIILVDDGSRDGTRAILQKYKDTHRVILQKVNRGKGAALRTGFKHAKGSIIIIQDADLEYNPDEYEKLLKPIIEDNADIVYGSRFVGGDVHRVLNYRHYLGNKVLTGISNLFSNLKLTDMETCYKVFKKDVLKGILLKSNRFGFEPEFTIKIAKKKYRIYEVGISYYGRTYEDGKHIGWKDGVNAIWCMLKYSIFD